MNGETIKRLRKERGLTQTDLSIATGIPQGTLGRIESNNLEVKKVEQLKALTEFFKNGYTDHNEHFDGLDIYSPDPALITSAITTVKHKPKKSLIPFYNSDFMAGTLETVHNDGSDHPDYYMDIPEFSGCTAFRAFGDSMEPIIKSSCILFGTKEEEWNVSLEYGQIYGITMLNGRRYLKYIRRADDHINMFLLKSENPSYDDFEVRKDKIKNIWLIQGWLDKRA